MKKFIVVCVTALFVVIAPVEHGWAFGGHGGHSGGHAGHVGGHSGGRFGHFRGHSGGHGFRGGRLGKFGHLPHGRIFRHRGGFPHKFRQRGFFLHHGGFGEFFAPLAFRVGQPVVIIKDPEVEIEFSPQTLKRVFGLTPREAMFAAKFFESTSLKETAEQMRISRESTREYLKRVFNKTDTHSQAELVKLLGGYTELRR